MERKRGEGKQRFLKGGQAGSRGGCLKKGGWNPLTNYAMKPQVQHRVISKLFYETNRYGKYSTNVGTVELWNKIQKQLKNM